MSTHKNVLSFKKLLFIMAMILCFNTQLFAKDNNSDNSFQIGVNRFAWYAALQTINFMPLISADPFSGVILTDWYSIGLDEKYKIDIYILEGSLTSQTVSVKVFKQKKVGSSWENIQAPEDMSNKIEEAILNSARKLRIESSIGKK